MSKISEAKRAMEEAQRHPDSVELDELLKLVLRRNEDFRAAVGGFDELSNPEKGKLTRALDRLDALIEAHVER